MVRCPQNNFRISVIRPNRSGNRSFFIVCSAALDGTHSSVHYGYSCIGIDARSMKSPIRQCALLLVAFTVWAEPALARNYLNCIATLPPSEITDVPVNQIPHALLPLHTRPALNVRLGLEPRLLGSGAVNATMNSKPQSRL